MILDDILEKLQKGQEDKAYTINEKSYTYSELYKFVCNIYHFLLKENKSKRPVIVYGHKDIYMKATFLACSFAGMTYVPIDINIPKERIKLIIEKVKPNVIIGGIICSECKNISEKNIYEIMNQNDYQKIKKIYLEPEDIYYIIFTSGSTGTPKGVKVTYKNINSCINWLKDITKIEKCVILNQANFSFDLSVADLYLSSATGSEHFIIETDSNMEFNKIFDQLKKSNSTIAIMTPSYADLLLLDKSFGKDLMPKLQTILFCGERLSNSTVNKLYSRFDNLKIINTYGPTECTFAVTSIELSQDLKNTEEIPVGRPKKDVDIIIVDENRNKLEDEEVGEILITGESVAAGYIGDGENKSFINYNNQKAYLTGDLGYIKNGNLYYKCRKDKQIKFKGYRIELSDIENNLQELDYIEKAVVVAKTDENDKVVKIIAFIKLKENKTESEIKKDLQEKIPEYMCPKIKVINEFPINRNGKCDEKKLLEEF